MSVSQQEILDELLGLEPDRWPEVRDFILFLKQRVIQERAGEHTRQLTARELLNSGLVGIWAGRTDIGDSLSFARELRRQAERRGKAEDAAM